MANEGPTSGPDLQSLIRASMPQQAGSGTMYIFGARSETNVGNGMNLTAAAPVKFDSKLQCAAPKRVSGLSKLIQDMLGDGIMAGMQKCAQAGPVREASQTEIFGQGGPGGGGSFAANFGPSGGDDFGRA